MERHTRVARASSRWKREVLRLNEWRVGTDGEMVQGGGNAPPSSPCRGDVLLLDQPCAEEAEAGGYGIDRSQPFSKRCQRACLVRLPW